MGKLRFWTGLIEAISFFTLVAMIVFFVIAYTTLPEKVALAFDGDTSAVEGGRIYFLVIFWLGMAAYSLLFILKRFPRLMSYPVRITPENVDIQARLARLMLSILTLFCMLIILLVLLDLYMRTINSPMTSHFWLILCLFGGAGVNVGVYLLVARAKK